MLTKSRHSNVGQLRKRIEFTFIDTVTDASSDGMGGTSINTIENPVSVVTVWGDIQPASGSEKFQAEALQEEITHTVIVRYRDDLIDKGYSRKTFDANLTAEYDGRTFNLTHVINSGEDNTYMKIGAKELVN